MNYIEVNIKNTKELMKDIGEKRYYQLRVNRYIPIIEMVSKYITEDSAILDIGIREGAFLKVLRDFGYTNLYGIDIYKEGVEQANKDGFACIVADVQKPNFWPGRKWRLITMSHVLEHCPNVKGVIENIYNHLYGGGILFIEVPKEKKEKKYPTKFAHYYNFTSLIELASFFEDSKWDILDSGKNESGKRLKIVVRKK